MSIASPFAPPSTLDEQQRYYRHLILPEVGDEGQRLHRHVDVATYRTRLTSSNALELLGDYDVIVDGSDNFAMRYFVNDACVLPGKPSVSGSVLTFEGQASVFSAADARSPRSSTMKHFVA